MKKAKRLLILLMAIVMTLGIAACNPAKPADTILVIGVDATFEEKWNPFLVESAYDHQVVDQIFTPICQINAKNELEPYGGTIKAEQQDDGGVLYTITVNKNMTFTDGEKVTIDDYLYGLYVRADPSYSGKPGSLLGSFIEGINEYFYDNPNYSTDIAGIETEAATKYAPENITWEDFLLYAKETGLDAWWTGDPAGDIGDGRDWATYVTDEGYGDDLAKIDATNADQMLELVAKVEYELYKEAYDTVSWFTDYNKAQYALNNLAGGVNVTEISGVKRVDDYTCTVKYTKIDIYADRGLAGNHGAGNLIPEHYYGKLTKGDVAPILANMNPMGSGPYIWGGFADNIATATANTKFFKGVPKTGTVRWQYIPQNDIMPNLAAGNIDIANPSAKKETVAEIRENPDLRMDLIDNAGYGYMAMNTERVPLQVRKGLFSLMNRQPTVAGYYGPDLAQVIERPMTTTLAEYPVDATTYYPYSPDEALKYFQAAGYTQQNGKLVDASGKQLVLNCYIGGSGKGEHPAYAMLVQAQTDMEKLGGEIQIQDVGFAVLQGAMNDGTADAWIMAWGAVYDCDKSTQFHSTGGQNRYRFKDAQMDGMLESIVQTVDLAERRTKVAEMLDYAMDQALELPIYQRKNMLAYNVHRVNTDTIPEATTAADYQNVLWKVEVIV